MKTNKKPAVQILTHEGAKAQVVSPYLELRRTVLNCLLGEDQFYESGQSIKDRIAELSKLCPPERLATLCLEARESFKLRHVPLWLACCLLEHRGCNWTAGTIAAILKRPDEAGELLSLYLGGPDRRKSQKKLPAALKRGIALAFQGWDGYQLGKWQKESQGISVRDALFLCHAKPKDEAQAALWKQLVDGTLPTPDTWEVALSAGKDKKETWERLLKEKKLPGMATLMNLRNMQKVKVDLGLIRERLKAGIGMALPFRFLTAARYAPDLEPELDLCMLKGLEDLPKLPGSTLCVIDVSGSMDSQLSEKGETTRMDAACGVAIHVREKCEIPYFCTFSDKGVGVPPRRGMALRDAIVQSQPHGSTQLKAALMGLQALQPELDRLIVITDEQSHDGIHQPWAKWSYVINVGSYKPGLSYGNGWVHIDGFSERVLEWIHEYEKAETGETQNG
jgi:TROVE domain.